LYHQRKQNMSNAVSDVVRLQTLVDRCKEESGNNDRQKVFAQYAEPIQDLICLIYDKLQAFHVKSKSVESYEKKIKKKVTEEKRIQQISPHHSLAALLQDLSDGTLSGHNALDHIVRFLWSYPEQREAILGSINKNLKIRVGIPMVNKSFPGLVPVFSCMLGIDIEKQEKWFQNNKGEWKISRKIDGNRALMVVQKGKPVLRSRAGFTYPSYIPELQSFYAAYQGAKDGVYDSEMIVQDMEGNDDFEVTNAIMNVNATPTSHLKPNRLHLGKGQKLYQKLFNFIPLKEFFSGKGTTPWNKCQELLRKNMPQHPDIHILEQYDDSEEEKLWTIVEERGWEGLMFNLSTAPFEGKRTKNLLKKKVVEDAEFTIEEATVSEQMIPGESGFCTALEHVGCSYKGERFWVGGGFKWEEKVEFAQNPQQLVGWTIKVKFNGVTTDRNGKAAPRHPRKIGLWPRKDHMHGGAHATDTLSVKGKKRSLDNIQEEEDDDFEDFDVALPQTKKQKK